MMWPVRLEEAGRDEDLELGGELLHRQHRRMRVDGPRAGEMAFVLGPAEIEALEQFGRQHHLRALAGGLAHQLGDVGDILADVRPEGELEGGDCQAGHAGTCWLMQWKLPPPVRIWSARSPTATRSGNRACDRGHRRLVVRRAVERHDDGGIADVEVHVGGRDDLVVALDLAGGGDGRPRPAPKRRGAAGGVAIDGLIRIAAPSGSGSPACPRATKRARLSTWPSVWSLSSPSPSQSTRSMPRSARSRASISPRDSQGLRFGLSRHCSVVTARPVPSTSIAPPSRIQSCAADVAGSPPRRAGAPIVSSPGSSYFPPQPLKPKLTARTPGRAAHDDRPGVAQPDVAEGLRRRRSRRARPPSPPRPRPDRRRRAAPPRPCRRPRPPARRRRPRPGPARDRRPRARHGSESRSRRSRAAPIRAAGGGSCRAHCPARERSRIARNSSPWFQFGHSVDVGELAADIGR